jgi:hypothetical protein
VNLIIKQSLIVLCLVFSFSGHAQYAINDLDLDGDVIKWYDESSNMTEIQIFEGSIYTISRLSRVTHQFFIDYRWSPGTIVFDGQTFDYIFMLYDVRDDLLLIKNVSSTGGAGIRINQEKIESFSFRDVTFKNLKSNPPPSGEGIYQVIYEGKQVNLYAKRIKSYKVKAEFGEVGHIHFYHSDKYYISYKDEYVSFKGKKAFLTTFKEFKPELKKFIKLNRLKIAHGNDDDIKKLITYCDKLTSKE